MVVTIPLVEGSGCVFRDALIRVSIVAIRVGQALAHSNLFAPLKNDLIRIARIPSG